MIRRVSGALLTVALVAGAAAIAHLRSDAMGHYLATQRYEDVYYLPPARWLPVLSLGYREALADLLWMRALIYFGEELEHRRGAEHARSYADAILELDPQFHEAYRWAATVGMYKVTGHSVGDVRASIEYLERAARLFPNDGELAWDLGAAYSFELAPLVDDPVEKAELKRTGVEHMQAAARMGAGPSWLALTNATQLERLGRTEQAARHLEEMYAYVDDPETRQEIERRLQALRSEAYGEAFRRFHQELEQRRVREFPYLEPGVHVLLGPRPPVNEAKWLESRFADEGVLDDSPSN